HQEAYASDGGNLPVRGRFDRPAELCYPVPIPHRKEESPMELSYIRQGGRAVAELTGPEPVLTDAQSALELAMTARYAAGADRLLVDKAAVAEDFFILSTGLAGEILQKFVNYQVKMAVYGD